MIIWVSSSLGYENIHTRFQNWDNIIESTTRPHNWVTKRVFRGQKNLRYFNFRCSLTAKWMGERAPQQNDSLFSANINWNALKTSNKSVKDVVCQVTSFSSSECQILPNWEQEIKDYLPLNRGLHYTVKALCTLARALETTCTQTICIHHNRQICTVYQRDQFQEGGTAVTGTHDA